MMKSILFTGVLAICLGVHTAATSTAPAVAQGDHSQHLSAASSESQAAAYLGDPYPLNTCPVTGEELGSMGGAVSYVYAGREIRFCCAPCIKSFERNPDSYLKQIDAEIVKLQLADYPLDTCIVAGSKLGDMGEPVNAVVGNRLFRLCCAGCIGAIEDDPARFVNQLDEAVVSSQLASYPLSTCIVMPEHKLDADSVNYVMAGRLFRLCCEGCIGKLTAVPAVWLAKLDAAARK
jgi:YHS domain-containing protein